MKKIIIGLAFSILCIGTMTAQEKKEDTKKVATKKWQARFRWVTVVPNESATIQVIGGDVDISTTTIPELDFTYFFTENIAAELILGTSKHNVKAEKTALGTVDLGSVWLLPPTLNLQYHFNLGNFRPYVGAGVNYTFFYDVDPGAVKDVEYENAFGFGGQLGFDYDLNDTWFLNVDAKYLQLGTDVTVKTGAANVPATVDINPLLIGFGVGMRF